MVDQATSSPQPYDTAYSSSFNQPIGVSQSAPLKKHHPHSPAGVSDFPYNQALLNNFDRHADSSHYSPILKEAPARARFEIESAEATRARQL
ncbi:hypothetical protein FGO68_gene9175 [Halteria grandinella]|uniref:Uncharacterized protein n=1 Tax=Halteria grandinella TaxID=5974 RepID=A0A8J8NV45_HALGN|nr:hypothetical protein FGO68_gene9175 [Halteria grandinella]